MVTALLVCLVSASNAVWMESSLLLTSSTGESVVEAMVVREKFIQESRVTVGLKNTVEKLSNSVHGYPSWFTN